ncbi:MAG TPA: hypothetical protein VLV78_20405 [Thermoanaerobaculia bacterium]|nr:hypothetical protein [Thermoanaerobaculia bacterium]
MFFAATILSMILAMPAGAGAAPELQREIETFIGHLKSARMAEAYGQMSVAAKHDIGRAQFDAYVASRRRALGAIVGVANVHPSGHVDPEPGSMVYEADIRFEKASAQAGFVMAKESGEWRIHRFVIALPEGVKATPDVSEAMPIAKELLALAKAQNAAALASHISEKDLAEAEQTPETALAAFTMLDELLGRLQSFTLDKIETDEQDCVTVRGNGTFEHAKAPLQLVLCWVDGVWRLRHAEITALMDPRLLERSIAYMFHGKVKAECPQDAEFPVGGKIVCRVTEQGRAPQDATILRTTLSGWKIVALEPPKK